MEGGELPAEGRNEMTAGLEAELEADFLNGQLGVAQQIRASSNSVRL